MDVCDLPETRYATVEGRGQVAYQAVGGGPVDVLVLNPLLPVDLMWEEPRLVRSSGYRCVGPDSA
jgi:hypothetical protein